MAMRLSNKNRKQEVSHIFCIHYEIYIKLDANIWSFGLITLLLWVMNVAPPTGSRKCCIYNSLLKNPYTFTQTAKTVNIYGIIELHY